MRKYKLYLLGTFLGLLCSSSIYSNQESVDQVDKLIEENIYKNQEEIEKLSWNLTDEERTKLVDKYQRDVFTPVFLNLLFGFGIGSYVEGDIFGGVLGSVTGGVYYTTLTIGIVSYAFDQTGNPWGHAGPWFIAAGVSGVTYLLVEILRPSGYADKFNKVLLKSLKAKQKLTFNVLPFSRVVDFTGRPDDGALMAFTTKF